MRSAPCTKGIQVSPWFFYSNYLIIVEYDKAMDYPYSIYNANPHNPELPNISAKPIYDKMKGNPKYIELLKKMNLPIN